MRRVDRWSDASPRPAGGAISTAIVRFDTRNVRRVLAAAAVLGLALGIETVIPHATTDPFADLHAYVDAGARLNAGQPLYVQPAGTNDAAFYRYPPLLAIAFRALSGLPFWAVAAVWSAALLAALALTIRRLGVHRRSTWLAVGMLALPIGWSLVIGQAQVLVTLLLAIGSPWSVALAANLKLFPAVVALWWIGRGEWRQLASFVAWLAALAVAQLVLEPAGTLAYPAFVLGDQVGSVNTISPYAASPAAWALVVAAATALTVAAIRDRSRLGWPAVVALSVLANPRLLVYQLMSLLAGLREPDDRPR